VVGFLERRASLKGYSLVYEARGRDQTSMLQSILDAMDRCHERLANVDRDAIGEFAAPEFYRRTTKKEHERLRGQLLAEPSIDALFTFRDQEED